MSNTPKWIVVHATDVSWRKAPNQLNSVNLYHKGQNYPLSRLGYYVGYHSLITAGKNTRTRLDSEEGAHTNQQVDGFSINKQSLGVCVGFDGDVEYPAPEDYLLLKKQVQRWQEMYSIPNERVVYHRHFNKNKTCPGSLLGVEWLKELLRREPHVKPDEQEEKQVEILKQRITLLQRLISLYLKLK